MADAGGPRAAGAWAPTVRDNAPARGPLCGAGGSREGRKRSAAAVPWSAAAGPPRLRLPGPTRPPTNADSDMENMRARSTKSTGATQPMSWHAQYNQEQIMQYIQQQGGGGAPPPTPQRRARKCTALPNHAARPAAARCRCSSTLRSRLRSSSGGPLRPHSGLTGRGRERGALTMPQRRARVGGGCLKGAGRGKQGPRLRTVRDASSCGSVLESCGLRSGLHVAVQHAGTKHQQGCDVNVRRKCRACVQKGAT